MATVRPFRGWRYNPQKIRNMASVLAPPYDVIGEAQFADYCARSPYNIVHLTLGIAPFSPDPYRSRYPQAAHDLWHWRHEEILIQEEMPAVYVYEQDYEDPLEGPIRRRGYIAAVKLHAYEEQVILPHEHIRPAVKTDRWSLMRACKCTFSQIFGLFSDPSRTVEKIVEPVRPPTLEFEVTDDDGVVHRMGCLMDPEIIEAISAAMADKQIIIADGHHRYQAALAYRDEMRSQQGIIDEAPWEYTTMFLCNTEADTLTILPSHRLIKELPVAALAYLQDLSGELFAVSEHRLPMASAQRSTALHELLQQMRETSNDNHIFAVYTGNSVISLLQAPRGTVRLGDWASERSEAWRKLDLSVLHYVILQKLLGLSGRYLEGQKNISFAKNAEEALALVDRGESAMAILVNPPRVSEVVNMAQAGDQMPQKGTYFYPKPRAGAVIYDLQA